MAHQDRKEETCNIFKNIALTCKLKEWIKQII